MWHSTPAVRMMGRAHGRGQQRYNQIPSTIPYGHTPLAPYTQGTTWFGGRHGGSRGDTIAAGAVAIISITCIATSLVVIFAILQSKPVDDDAPPGDGGDPTRGDDGQAAVPTLHVPREILIVTPMSSSKHAAGMTSAIMTPVPQTTATVTTTTTTETTTPVETTTTSKATTTLKATTMTETTTLVSTTTTARTTTSMKPTTTLKTTETTARTTTSMKPTTTLKTTETTTETTTLAKTTTTTVTVTTAEEMTTPAETTPTAKDTTVETTTTEMTTPDELTSPSSSQVNRQPLLCTMGATTYLPLKRPNDGLCDYLFFDSIYKRGISTFDPPDEIDADLQIFVGKRKGYNTTAFGIGFSYKYAPFLSSAFSRSVNPNSPFMVGYFWRQSIYHFGILDTPTNDVKEASVKQALNLLKIVDGFSELQRAQGQPCWTVFAAAVPDSAWADFYVQTFSSTLWPHLFISLGHYVIGDNTFTDCSVMPPTLLVRPPEVASENSSYPYDLNSAVANLNGLTTTGTSPVWATSVTMKGRMTVLEPGEEPEFLSRCVHDPTAESFGNVAQVCEDPKFDRTVNDFQFYSTLIYSNTSRQVFSFDDEAAFKNKLCRLKGDHTSTDFGIAVFDVEYEDFANICHFANSRGSFSRLKAIRQVMEFFRANFKKPSDAAACLKLML